MLEEERRHQALCKQVKSYFAILHERLDTREEELLDDLEEAKLDFTEQYHSRLSLTHAHLC